jgi:hypothetical protein
MTEAQGKRGRPRAKIKAGFAGLSSSCGDGAADGQRGRRRSVLGLGERIPQKGSRSGPAFPARATPDAPGRIRCGDFFQLSPSTARKKSQMTNHTNQRFTAVANNDLGVYYVFDLYSEKNAIAVIKEDERNISYIIYEANDINTAVRHAENIYPNYHHVYHVKDILALS